MMLSQVLLLLLAETPLQATDFRACLPQDGTEVARPGVPGTVVVFGPEAEVVLTSGDSVPQVVAAAATVGRGRIFAIAHNGFLAPAQFENPGGLMPSALDWLVDAHTGKDSPPRVAFLSSPGPLKTLFHERGFTQVEFAWENLDQVQLLVLRGEGPLDEEQLAHLENWLQQGGAVLAAICPWGWQQTHAKRKGNLADDLAANQLMEPHGILFTVGTSAAARDNKFVIDRSQLDQNSSWRLVERLQAGERPLSLAPLEHALRALRGNDQTLLPRLLPLLPEIDESNAPIPERPLAVKEDPLLRLSLVAASRRYEESTAAQPLKAPGTDAFPGLASPDAKRIARTRSFAARAPGWQSTGLYLGAGEVLHLTLRSGSFEGWSYRIGCHADSLWHKPKWKRWPSVTRTGTLLDFAEGKQGNRSASLTSSFGGLLYLQAKGKGAGRKAPDLELEIKGAVEAPWWRHGVTSKAQWQKIRMAPAPWAELQGEVIVLTLPARAVRALDDPTPLMEWWDRVVAEQFSFAGEDPPARPERFVCDIQISAGYMHSGYPIMMGLDVAQPRGKGKLAVLLDLEELKAKGNWGCFHELGHNRQDPAWTFAGTGEVTNNLFSLYCGEVMSGIEPWHNPWLERQKKAGRDYLSAGSDFAQWKRKPGVALLTYAEVQRAFGWEPFQTVFRDVQVLSRAERPRSDQEKRDAWVRRLSLACAHDLRAFHQSWGWPLSDQLLHDSTLDALPEWHPDEKWKEG